MVDVMVAGESHLQALFSDPRWKITTVAATPEAAGAVFQMRPKVLLVDASARALVETVRAEDPTVRILLYGSTAAPHDMDRLDIEGLVRPIDDADAVALWVRAALRAWREREDARNRREILSRILDSLVALHGSSTAEELLNDVLGRLGDILGRRHVALAALASSRVQSRRLVRSPNGEGGAAALRVVASTGGKAGKRLPASFHRYMSTREPAQEGNQLFLPLHNGREPVGILCLENEDGCPCEPDLLHVLSLGIGQALEIRRLTSLASEDELTRTFTREMFFKMAETAIQSACREQSRFSLAVLDVDFFKRVNDRHGHLAGDRILRELGGLLRANLRPQDFVGRFGGDEFMVGLPRTGGADAQQVLERLRKAAASAFADRGATISVGIAALDCGGVGPTRPLNNCCTSAIICTKMLSAADRLLYVSKARGRNCVSCEEEDLQLAVLSAQLALPTAAIA